MQFNIAFYLLLLKMHYFSEELGHFYAVIQ